MKKQIIVVLECKDSDSDLTVDEIEKDLHMGEDQIGFYHDYIIKKIDVRRRNI